tara:strand:+ start:69 stop:890 length:822 start_codon:yes stop_codon:yes gene_type:complete
MFSQSEYQILSISKNVFELSNNGASFAMPNENNLTNPASFKIGYNHYGFSMINFPSQIKLYNCRIKNYSLSVLDFGTLKDQIDNVVYKTFSAQEILLKYFYNYKVRNLTLGISIGAFNSNIHTYNASGLVTSAGFIGNYKKINSSFGLSIENLGYIFKSYTSYHLPIPLLYRFSFHHQRKSFIIGYEWIYTKSSKEFQHILCFEFQITNKIKLRFSDSNYLNNLQVENYDYNFLSGMGLGFDLKLNNINLNFGFKNLGIAGPIYGISINFLKN